MADEPRDDITSTNESKPKKPGGVTGKGFVKGDPRCHRGGRPKSFDALRRLTQQILSEVVTSADKSVAMSRVELIVRDWTTSKDIRKQMAVVEYAYGKVPAPVDVKAENPGTARILITLDK